MAESRSFSPGDLVWAKMKGYPAWPARVESPRRGQVLPKRKYLIFFYGTHEMAYMGANSIYPFEENKDKFSKPNKGKGFTKAMMEIKKNPAINVCHDKKNNGEWGDDDFGDNTARKANRSGLEISFENEVPDVKKSECQMDGFSDSDDEVLSKKIIQNNLVKVIQNDDLDLDNAVHVACLRGKTSMSSLLKKHGCPLNLDSTHSEPSDGNHSEMDYDDVSSSSHDDSSGEYEVSKKKSNSMKKSLDNRTNMKHRPKRKITEKEQIGLLSVKKEPQPKMLKKESGLRNVSSVSSDSESSDDEKLEQLRKRLINKRIGSPKREILSDEKKSKEDIECQNDDEEIKGKDKKQVKWSSEDEDAEYADKRKKQLLIAEEERHLPEPPRHLKGNELLKWNEMNKKEIELKVKKLLTEQDKKQTAKEKQNGESTECENEPDGIVKEGDLDKLLVTSSNTIYDKDSSTCIRKEPDDNELGENMLDQSTKNRSVDDSIMHYRRQLPAYDMKDQIIDIVKKNQVSLISGETGCGKTTQVAQFILDDYISKNNNGSLCHIICTQPRRISAISVAQRVAKERNENIGESCGYHIRMEHRSPRNQESITFCTVGVLLRMLISDPEIQEASHLILDEINERDINSDFLLVIIRDLLPLRPDLKVVLMSATLNATIFSKYFNDCPHLEIPGRTFMVKDYYLEDYIANLSYKPKMVSNGNDERYLDYLKSNVNGYPTTVIQRLRQMRFQNIDNELITALLLHIINTSQDGAILMFLPSARSISKLHKVLSDTLPFSNKSLFLLIPLHCRLPTVSQQQIFAKPPPGCRKIVLATSIAETSITIDDVVYVVDSGKTNQCEHGIQSSGRSLNSNWISKASHNQRKGHAGRVQPGYCFHLFTKHHHSNFIEFQLPEMLRTPLDTLCLQIKLLNLGKIWDFLSKAVEPPSFKMCQQAIEGLIQMRALDSNENLTPLGHHLALLPLPPKLGRMILFGAIFSCLDPVLTIAASLDSNDPFTIPPGKERLVDIRKREFCQGYKSDYITLLNAFYDWEKVRYRDEMFCWHNFLSQSQLKLIDDKKSQFTVLLKDIGFVNSTDSNDRDANMNSNNMNLIKAVICAGLYPNIAKISYSNTQRNSKRKIRFHTVADSLKVCIHASSVNSREKNFHSPWLMFHNKVKLDNTTYLSGTTMISPNSLLFFGGSIRYHKEGGQEMVEVDHGIKFHSSIRTAELVIELREELDKLLGRKIKNAKMQLAIGQMKNNNDKDDEKLLKTIIDLISTEQANILEEKERTK